MNILSQVFRKISPYFIIIGTFLLIIANVANIIFTIISPSQEFADFRVYNIPIAIWFIFGISLIFFIIYFIYRVKIINLYKEYNFQRFFIWIVIIFAFQYVISLIFWIIIVFNNKPFVNNESIAYIIIASIIFALDIACSILIIVFNSLLTIQILNYQNDLDIVSSYAEISGLGNNSKLNKDTKLNKDEKEISKKINVESIKKIDIKFVEKSKYDVSHLIKEKKGLLKNIFIKKNDKK